TLFCLGLALGVNSALHPAIAGGEVHAFSAFRLSGQEAQRQAGKATAVALGRLALWIFAFLNLHVAINLVFGIADTVGGFDVALLELVLSLSNPAYCIALLFVMLALTAPVVEATNYLLHIDARTRYEGLDLWYRVRRLFPRGEWSRASSALLGLGTLLVASSQARAEDNRLATIRAARQEVGTITQEIAAAEPYPGSERWLPRLRAVADRLNRDGSTRPRSFRWFEKAVAGLPRRNRERALEILKELDGRLALIEETVSSDEASTAAGPRRSKEEIEALLPSQNSEAEAREAERERARRDKAKERVRRDDRDQDGPERGEGQGTGIMVPVLGGFRLIGWLLLGGLLVAVLVVAIVLWLQHRGSDGQRK